MLVVGLITVVLLLAASTLVTRRRRQTRTRPTVDDVVAATLVRSEIAAARIDAEREKGRQWY